MAREINPNDERAYQSFGLLLMKQRNFAVAVAVFAEAARLNPANPMNAVMRATALIHQAANMMSRRLDGGSNSSAQSCRNRDGAGRESEREQAQA